jgi:hypothetical protein
LATPLRSFHVRMRSCKASNTRCCLARTNIVTSYRPSYATGLQRLSRTSRSAFRSATKVKKCRVLFNVLNQIGKRCVSSEPVRPVRHGRHFSERTHHV